MAQITRIGTFGYRGPKTHNAYLPAGEYVVGDETDYTQHIVSRDLADYLVSIDLAWIVAVDDHMPTSAHEAFMHPVEPASVADKAIDLAYASMPDHHRVVDPDALPDLDEQLDSDEVADNPVHWDYEALESLTVDELRAMAGANNIALPDGYVKKADLIELLLTHD